MKRITLACALVSALLAGCYGPRVAQSRYPDRGDVVIGEDYDYYPAYEAYYSRQNRIYVYRTDRGGWVRRAEPPRGWHRGDPSVRVHFRDGPEFHHDEVIRRYPRNWHPQDYNRQIEIGR